MSRAERREIKSMADIYRSRGLYQQAAELYELLIKLERSAADCDAEDLGLLCYQLAESYSAIAKYEEAQPLYKEAVSLWERQHPEDALNWLWYLEALTKLENLSRSVDEHNAHNNDIGIA